MTVPGRKQGSAPVRAPESRGRTDSKPRPKTARGRRTRTRLLDAAAEEFGARGFHDASVASITAAAGVAQGTFYIYFDSKEDLFRQLVLDMGQRLREHLEPALGAVRDRIEAERAGLKAFLTFARDNGNFYRIVMEAQFVDPDVFRRYFSDFGKAYTENLDRAARKGQIRPGNAEVRAWALMGISVFLGLRFAVWDAGDEVEDLVDGVMDMLADGLRPDGAGDAP